MTEKPIPPDESNDKKEILIIATVGIVFLICVCCLMAAAGYFLYKDISPSLNSPSATMVPPTPTTAAQTPVEEATPVDAMNESWNDSFTSNRNGWTEGSFEDEYGQIDYTINGTYTWDVVAAKGVSQRSWATSAPVVEDFTVTTDATHISGAENASYGIIFRVMDNQNLYYFAISDVGYYYVGLLVNDEWITLLDWTETDTINVNSPNTLKVVGKGDQFTFYINGNEVNTLSDGTVPSGTAGLAIELYDKDDQSVFEFDNFSLDSP